MIMCEHMNGVWLSTLVNDDDDDDDGDAEEEEE